MASLYQASERRSEWRSGWAALLGATGATATGAAMFIYSAGLFVAPMQAELGWTKTAIAGGATAAMVAMALFLPFVGAVADRLGSRTVGLAGSASYGAACLGLSLVPADLPVYYGLLMLAAVTSSAVTAGVFAPVVIARFARSRGLALGIMMSGVALAMIPFGPVLSGVMESYGWRAGYRMLAVAALAVGLPCSLLIPRRSPTLPVAGLTEPAAQEGASFREALATAAYWKIMAGSAAAALALGGFVNQFPSLLADKALPAQTVTLLVSFFVGMVVVGRLSVGLLFDRFSPPLVALGIMLCAGGAALLMLVSGSSVAIAAFGVAVVGVAMGAEADIPAYLTARQFGLRAYAAIFGTFGMITAVGLGFGALLFGAIFDVDQSYDRALILAAALFTATALLFGSVGAPRTDPDAPRVH